MLRLSRPDPLAIDNELPFHHRSHRSWKNLGNVGKRRTGQATRYLGGQDHRSRRCDTSIGDRSISSLRSIWKITRRSSCVDPTGLDDSIVAKIDTAIQSGLGAMLIMGASLSSPSSGTSRPSANFIPDALHANGDAPITDRSIFLRNVNPAHPVWSEFGSEVTNIPWNRYPIFKYWSWRDLPTVRRSLVQFAPTGHPGLIEQTRGSGKVIGHDHADDRRRFARTTAMEFFVRPPSTRGRTSAAFRGHPSSARDGRLATQCRRRFASDVGKPIGSLTSALRLFTPSGQVVRIQAQTNHLHYPYADELGTYRLRMWTSRQACLARLQHPPQSSYSRSSASHSRTISDSILVRDQYFFVKDRDQLQSSIGHRDTVAIWPLFLLCVLAVLAIGEQAMSYRFYSIGTTKRT